MARPTSNEQVLQGTLDLLILKTLSLAPMHGWGLTHRIEQLSKEMLQVGQGSIYPALVRLEQRGWIDTEWRTTENSRRAKYYELTRTGRKQLEQGTAKWHQLASLVATLVLAWRNGYSPLEMVSQRADRAFVAALRQRFPRSAAHPS